MHVKKKKKPDAVAYACNPSSREAEKADSQALLAKQSSLTIEFQVKWETLSQKPKQMAP